MERGLEETDGLAHRRLDVQRLDVLPVLLQEGHEEVDAKHDVSENLILGHLDVSDGNTEAENLLELELDRAAHLGELVVKVLGVRDGGRELSGLGETGAKQTRDLTNERLRGQECIVLLCEFLDELLVLVELLQVVNGHVLELNLLSPINISRIRKNADRHARTGDIGKLDGTRETLVTLGVVVLESDLELDGLNKVALLLAVGIGQELFDGASHA